MRYKWEIRTSDTWYAGTDANVFLSLTGLDASMREVQISDPDSVNDWEQGETNHGIIETEDLGELQTGTLRHDQSGPASGWSVDWVKVTAEETGREWTAPIGRFDVQGRFPPLRFARTNDGLRDLPQKQKAPESLADQAALFLKNAGWSPEKVEQLLQGPQKGEPSETATAAPKTAGTIHHFVTLRTRTTPQDADDDAEAVSTDEKLALADRPAKAKALEHHFVTLKKPKTTD